MSPMAGKLDDISRLLGNLETKVDGIKERSEEDRAISDRRHAENQRAIAAAAATAEELRTIVEPLSETVQAMQPTVRALAVSRSKLASLAGLGLLILSAIGWLGDALIKALFTWTLSHLH